MAYEQSESNLWQAASEGRLLLRLGAMRALIRKRGKYGGIAQLMFIIMYDD